MENMEITREYIIQTLKELDAKSEKTVGGSALAQKGINPYQIRTLIPEGLTKLKQDLGLTISRQERPLLDDELLEQMDKVVSKLKHIPTFEEIRRETGTTDKVFRSRFGKKGNVRYLATIVNGWRSTNQNRKTLNWLKNILKIKVKQ